MICSTLVVGDLPAPEKYATAVQLRECHPIIQPCHQRTLRRNGKTTTTTTKWSVYDQNPNLGNFTFLGIC